jgi:flagellar hook-length control protein FliK
MQSVQVNASQLLASFLGSENEKIGQCIAQSDFACELKKHIPAPANSAMMPGDVSQSPLAKSENASAPDPKLQASSAEKHAASQKKPSGSSMTRAKKAAADTKTKIDSIKSKAKQEASLFVANPIADTVLGDLQCPAEIRKACNGIQSQDGSISIKDLKSLVDTQPANGATDSAKVPAEHARALVESIIAREGAAGQQGSASGTTLQSSIQIKTEGSYTPAEFKELLEKVLEVAQTQQQQTTGSGILSGSAEAATIPEGLKTGQTEGLTASVLPSFVSGNFGTKDFGTKDFENVSGKTVISQAKSPSLEAQSVNAGNVHENSTDSVSGNLKYDERLVAARFSTQDGDLDGAALGTEAGTKGGGQAGPTTGPAAASPSVLQESVQMPLKGLDPILNNLNAAIVSAGLQQPELRSAVAPVPGTPHEGSVAQAQNLASPVKGVEKQADRPRGTLGSMRLSQDVAEQSDAARIKTVAAEYPSSERSFDGDPNLADTSQKIQAKAPASTIRQDKITEEFQQTSQAVESDGKKTPDETSVRTGEEAGTAAESLSGKSSDSVEGFDRRVDLSTSVKPAGAVPQNGTQGIAAKTDSKETQVELGQATQGEETAGKAASVVAGESQAAAGGKMVSQQEFPAGPLRFGFPMEDVHSQDDASVSGEESNSSASLHESVSATGGIEAQKAVETQTAVSAQNTAVVSEHIDKQVGSKDSAPENAVAQGSVPGLQGAGEIKPARMDNSAGNGFAYYDPYRSAELAQSMREQAAGAGARQLVLEMEPDELGKISIKVGAKKDEISVEALTQSVDTKAALMSHAPELRQDLKDQGLVLDKFMVDVNGQKSGGGNYPEGDNAKGKTVQTPKTAAAGSVRTSGRPVYVRQTDDRSQISIFA